jgi:hypothetical protein
MPLLIAMAIMHFVIILVAMLVVFMLPIAPVFLAVSVLPVLIFAVWRAPLTHHFKDHRITGTGRQAVETALECRARGRKDHAPGA